MENENPLEAKEHLEHLAHAHGEHAEGWTRYLAITTALIAVLAAVAALIAGNYANDAVLDKNEAVLAQAQASDQYAYYEAKGIKKNLAEYAYEATKNPARQSEATQYGQQQTEIKKTADADAARVTAHNAAAQAHLEQHHHAALGVTFFQIAIALAAMSALLRRKSFWALSIALTVAGSIFFGQGLRA
jgi:preprotein translocase subunit SecG